MCLTISGLFNVHFYFQKFFRKKSVKDLLPAQPVDDVAVEHWWRVHVGYITEDDIKVSITVCSLMPCVVCEAIMCTV